MTHGAELRLWYAARTRSRAEASVESRLASQGVETFLPTFAERIQWSDRSHITRRPLFPGYVFARLDGRQKEAAAMTAGLVQILGEPIPESQVESVRIACKATENLSTCPLQTGDLVRIENGPFAGCEAVVDRQNKHRLLLRVELLNRAVSLQIDRTTRLSARH